jgi:polyisoprenoid-binding protein YceI
MQRRKVLIGVIAGGSLIIVAALAFVGYVWFAGGGAEASRPVEAREVQPAEPASIAYDVVTDASEARFVIEEVLRGEPNTVVGRTDQIDGSIAVQFDPARVEIGEFVINVRTIETDDEVRDRTIRTLILESNKDEFEFSTFTPTQVRGVPETIAVGDTLELQVTGDLTVRDVTSTTSFDMTIEIPSESRITGSAATNVTWEEFDITIPYVGGNSIVASVADNLDLEMDFVGERRSVEEAE